MGKRRNEAGGRVRQVVELQRKDKQRGGGIREQGESEEGWSQR